MLLRILLAALMLALLLLVAAAPNSVFAKERDGYIPKEIEELTVAGDWGCALEVATTLSSGLPHPQRLYFLATEAVACDMSRLALGLMRRALLYDPKNTTYLDFLARIEKTLKGPQ